MFFNQKKFFTEEESSAIVKAIAEAEDKTSGEIRLHIEAKCKDEALDRAAELFFKLGMDRTKDSNGVLIYVAHENHKFAIIGDKGINHVVPANFWDGIKEVMREHFKHGEFYAGVLFAIQETGSHLKQYFPYQREDKNELPDEISEG